MRIPTSEIETRVTIKVSLEGQIVDQQMQTWLREEIDIVLMEE